MRRVYKIRNPPLDYCECGEVKLSKKKLCRECIARINRLNRKKRLSDTNSVKKIRSLKKPLFNLKGNGKHGIGSWRPGKIPRYLYGEDA